MKFRSLILIAAGLAAMSAADIVSARETARFLNIPATAAAPAVTSAVQYDLTLRLEARDLADAMLDAGIVKSDATTAAQLAHADLADDDDGRWEVKISISKTVAGGAFNLVRLRLASEAGQTVIERRGEKLIIASHYAARKPPRLV